MREVNYRMFIFSGLAVLINALILRTSFLFPEGTELTLLGFGELGAIRLNPGASIRVLGIIGVAGALAPLFVKSGKYVSITFFITAFRRLRSRSPTRSNTDPMPAHTMMEPTAVNAVMKKVMLTSACIGFTASLYIGNMWIGLFFAILSGWVIALLHAFLSVTMITDQIISGTVINILAVGLTGFIRRSFLLKARLSRTGILPIVAIPLLSKIPIIGKIIFTNQPIVFMMMGLVIFITLMLFNTRWGLRTRSIGEHPEAADTVGINVFLMRYLNVMIGGFIAGLAGAWFSLETTGSFDDLMTNGKGFISLAAMIFGKWHPVGAFTGGMIFGFSDALQIIFQIKDVPIPQQILWMLPYIITMVVLADVIGKSTPPAAVGVHYIKQ